MVAERDGLTASSAGAMARRPRRTRKLRDEIREAGERALHPLADQGPLAPKHGSTRTKD